MAQGELPCFAETRLRIGRARLAHLWLKSTEAYGNLPKSTESVILTRPSLLNKQRLFWRFFTRERLEGVVGKPVGVRVPRDSNSHDDAERVARRRATLWSASVPCPADRPPLPRINSSPGDFLR